MGVDTVQKFNLRVRSQIIEKITTFKNSMLLLKFQRKFCEMATIAKNHKSDNFLVPLSNYRALYHLYKVRILKRGY